MALAAVNLFTGAPLLAIWVGSRVQGDAGGLTMTAVLVVIVVMALLCSALVWALNRMGAAHDRADRPRRRPAPDDVAEAVQQRPRAGAQGGGLRALDKILVGAVVLAGLAFETWFFFFAGSSLGSG